MPQNTRGAVSAEQFHERNNISKYFFFVNNYLYTILNNDELGKVFYRFTLPDEIWKE